jgi:hypothetical protein
VISVGGGDAGGINIGVLVGNDGFRTIGDGSPSEGIRGEGIMFFEFCGMLSS